jgi:hypothetical protein
MASRNRSNNSTGKKNCLSSLLVCVMEVHWLEPTNSLRHLWPGSAIKASTRLVDLSNNVMAISYVSWFQWFPFDVDPASNWSRLHNYLLERCVLQHFCSVQPNLRQTKRRSWRIVMSCFGQVLRSPSLGWVTQTNLAGKPSTNHSNRWFQTSWLYIFLRTNAFGNKLRQKGFNNRYSNLGCCHAHIFQW